jgi:hypothetical protein
LIGGDFVRFEIRKDGNCKYRYLGMGMLFLAIFVYLIMCMPKTGYAFGNDALVDSNFKNLPDKLSPYDLRTGIVTEATDRGIRIAHRGEYYPTYIDDTELLKDSVLFEIKLDDLYGINEYEFNKYKMKRISRKDIKKGDLLYCYINNSEKNNSNGDDGKSKPGIRAIVVVSQMDNIRENDRAPWDGYEYDSIDFEMSEHLINVANIDCSWQFFHDDRDVLFDLLDINPDIKKIKKEIENKNISNRKDDRYRIWLWNFFGNYGKNFRYIPSPLSNREIEMVFYTDAGIKYMQSAHSSEGKYESIKKENGKYKVSYKDLDGKLQEHYLSSAVDDYTLLNIESNKYKKGDELFIYVNEAGGIESMKFKFKDSNAECFTVVATQHEASVADDNIIFYHTATKDGEENEVWVDFTRFPQLKGDLSEFVNLKIDEGNYVEYIENVSDDYENNIYRLLNREGNRVELGFNNLSIDSNADFSAKERVWVDLADDYKWFGEPKTGYDFKPNDDSELGANVSIVTNENGEIEYISYYHLMYAIYPCSAKSPNDRKAPSDMSFQISSAKKDENGNIYFEAHEMDDYLELKEFQVTGDTNYYEYEYDSSYLKANMNEWSALWNRDFENVKNLKRIGINDIDIEDNSIYLVNRTRDCKARNVVKIRPSKKEIGKVILGESSLIKDCSGKGDSSKYVEILDIDNTYLYSLYLSRKVSNCEAETDGWFLMGEKNKRQYLIIKSSDLKIIKSDKY